MNEDRWQQLKQHYQAASKLSAHERHSYLETHFADNASVRAEIESLLAMDDEDEGLPLLESAIGQTATELLNTDAREGDKLGAYRIESELGRGGMGTVWLATRDDDEYHTNVAIKVMHGLSGEQARERFLAERQMLANLNHPNIARMLDGGTTQSGAPYVVMEHVNGLPIDRYCSENALSLEERIDLFRAVCTAVHYAHRNLIVHRDLKPENILVTPDGQPKLLDFGIAKLLNEEFSADTPQTMLGQSMLTPRYASPEQVLNNTITTATDIYSLGVLLTMLLTGELPYKLDSDDLFELARAICEEEPLRPSHANPVLRGDLDNIILKAMRKEPESRYATASDLADDLKRHLKRQPVLARPATLVYRLNRFVSRNRLPVALGAVALAGLLLATAFSYRQMQLALEAQRSAEYERSVAVSENLRTNLTGAREAIEASDPVRATRLLERVSATDRNWAWSLLAARLDESLVSLMQKDAVAAGLWASKDIVTVSSTGRIQWWTGTQSVRTADLPVDQVALAHFSNDGTRLVTVEPSHQLTLWRLANRETTEALFTTALSETPVDLALSQHSLRLAIVTPSALSVWHLPTAEFYTAALPFSPERLSISANGLTVGVAFGQTQPEAYRIYSDRATLITTADGYDMHALALDPTGKRSATSEGDNTIRLRETSSTRVLGRYNGHRFPANLLGFSGDGTQLISGATDNTLRFWSTDSEASPASLMGLGSDTQRIHINRSGDQIVSYAPSGHIKLWHRDATAQSQLVSGRWIAAHPDNAQIYTLNQFGLLQRYDSLTLELFDQVTVGRLAATAFSLSDDGSLLAVGERGRVLIVDSATFETHLSFALPNAEVIALDFSPDRQLLLLLQSDGSLSMLSLVTQKVTSIEHVAPVSTGALQFTADGSRFVSALEQRLTLRDTHTLEVLHRYNSDEANALSLTHSRTADTLASGWDDGTIILFDGATLDVKATLFEGTSAITALFFTPDNAILAAGTSESELWLWSTATNRPLLNLNDAGTSRVDTLSITPDNRHILAGYASGDIRQWSTVPLTQRWSDKLALKHERQVQQPSVNTLWATSTRADQVTSQLRRNKAQSARAQVATLQLALSPPPIPRVIDRDPFNGYALAFSGGDDHVLAASPNGLVMTPQFTLELWVKPQPFAVGATPLSLRMLINKEGEYQIALAPDGALSWTVSSADGWMGWVPTRYRLEHGVWTHLALVRDHNQVRIYLNGQPIQEHAVPASIGDQHRYKNDFRIGGRQHTPSSMFGEIDEVRVWNTARSEADIQTSMQQRVDPDTPHLRASWSFDDGEGPDVVESTDAHPGTRVGARWVKTTR